MRFISNYPGGGLYGKKPGVLVQGFDSNLESVGSQDFERIMGCAGCFRTRWGGCEYVRGFENTKLIPLTGLGEVPLPCGASKGICRLGACGGVYRPDQLR
jgi:hypothetical protein